MFSYGIVFWGACRHIQPIKVLQNRVCRKILMHGKGTSEAEIYSQMKVPELRELHKIQIAMFIFKNKRFFQLHNTGLQTRNGQSTVASNVAWRKEHPYAGEVSRL